MLKRREVSLFTTIAGVLILAAVGLSVAAFIVNVFQNHWWEHPESFRLVFSGDYYIQWLNLILLSVALFVGKKELAACVTIGIIVHKIYFIIHLTLSVWRFYQLIWTHTLIAGLLAVFSYATLLLLLILTIKNKKIIKKMWFIPAVLFLGSYVIIFLTEDDLITGIYRAGMLFAIASFSQSLIIAGLKLAMLFFIGLWLKDNDPLVEISNEERTTFDPQVLKLLNTEDGTDQTAEEIDIIKGIVGKNKFARFLIYVGISVLLISLQLPVYFGGKSVVFLTISTIISQAISSIIIGLILKRCTENCEITVTNKRILGKLSRGRSADIPRNQIKGVRNCFARGVAVSAISAVNRFHCLENQEEVTKAIAYLLANPQQNSPLSTVPISVPDSQIDAVEMLKQYKELLDTGVITQEEFAAKKKQLLGI